MNNPTEPPLQAGKLSGEETDKVLRHIESNIEVLNKKIKLLEEVRSYYGQNKDSIPLSVAWVLKNFSDFSTKDLP